jgi:hypothetical protein
MITIRSLLVRTTPICRLSQVVSVCAMSTALRRSTIVFGF